VFLPKPYTPVSYFSCLLHVPPTSSDNPNTLGTVSSFGQAEHAFTRGGGVTAREGRTVAPAGVGGGTRMFVLFKASFVQ
jgi:hypothetical protein